MATIELNDQFTNEWTVFEEANKAFNGNLITDMICDGIIYKKVDSKYYRRILENDAVNVKWFGAKGDELNDDTAAVQLAVDFLKSIEGGTVFFPKGKYLISNIDFIGKEYSNISIIGNQAIIKQKLGPKKPNALIGESSSRHLGIDGVFVFNSQAYREYNESNSIKNIRIKGIRFESINNFVPNPDPTPPALPIVDDFDELMSQIVLCGVSDVVVEDCQFINFHSDGITILGSIHENSDNDDGDNDLTTETKRCYNGYVEIRNCLFDGVNCNNRQGISVYYCDHSLIENCIFKNITKHNMVGAIDYESDSKRIYQRSAIVRNCYFENIGGEFGAISILMHNVEDEYPDPTALVEYTPETTAQANPDMDTIIKSNSFKGFVFENNTFEKVCSPLFVLGVNDNYLDYKGNYIIKFKDSSVNHSKLFLDLRKAYGVLVENNTFTNIKEGALVRTGACKVLLKDNNISNVGEAYALYISGLSSEIDIIGNSFKHVKSIALNFQFKESVSKIIDNDFGSPENPSPLFILGDGNATPEDFINVEIRENKHSGYIDLGTYYFLSDGSTTNLNYTQFPPSKILYGKSEFESINAFPDPTYLGDFIGLVKSERIKDYNNIPCIVQTFIPYDSLNTLYRRRAISYTDFSDWKEI